MVKKLTEKQMAKRNERILKMYARGTSTRVIAEAIGLSKSRVGTIVKGHVKGTPKKVRTVKS
jgi:DNA-binding NarL/FixJ family response regulator